MSSWKNRIEPYSKHLYAVYEALGAHGSFVGGFDSVTGGEQSIAAVSYKVMDGNGHVVTRFMPGQVSYTPISLLRPMDQGSIQIYETFVDTVSGKMKKVRKNYSLSMLNDDGLPVVWWDLINAIPVKISGFDFNEVTETYYTDFTIDIQAEEIYVTFVAPSSD